MSASPSPLLAQAASMTSSGFVDGLGRRVLTFDREEGAMLERLVLRPELGAFEAMLRERVDKLAALEDERIARPRTIQRDIDGSLVVVSEFVPGSRLSDLLETAAELGASPGVDAALGFLLDIFPALCGLHAATGFAHGSISPSRTVLTPAGQIVLLDAIYGGALKHLRYSRRKLWTEFATATYTRPAASRIDVENDIAQAAVSAVMLVVGRPLEDHEYLDGLSAIVREVGDVAQIRGSSQFASRFQTFLQRALPLPNSQPYSSVDDALFDVRQIAAELGVDVCRRGLVDFIEQMESPSQPRAFEEPENSATPSHTDTDAEAQAEVLQVLEALEEAEPAQDLEAAVDAEIDLEGLVEESYDLNEAAAIEVAIDEPVAIAAAPVAEVAEEEVDWIAAAAESARSEQGAQAAAAATKEPRLAVPEPVVATAPVVVEAPAPVEAAKEPAVRSRRAKRGNRPPRLRKDKLRSTAKAAEPPALIKTPEPPVAAAPPPSPPPAPAPKSSSPWLVAPDRAAAFEQPIPDPVPFPVAPAPVAPVPPPVAAVPPAPPPVATIPLAPRTQAASPIPTYVAPPAPIVEPGFSRTVGAIAPSYEDPPSWPSPSPATSTPAATQSGSLKLKEVPRQRTPRPEPSLDIYSPTPPSSVLLHSDPEPATFPWKLAAALVAMVAAAVIGGWMYLPAKGVQTEGEAAVAAAATPGATPPPAAAAPPVASTTTGRLEIDTQPAGARILIDGKAAGESPVALDVTAGRHTVTLISSSGAIKRTVRIEAGRTSKLDVPIFSGWVGIYAPFVVEVSEGGRVIGTTEEPRLMLTPGKHDLTLVNRDLGYTSSQSVEIEPGEVRSISIDPRGTVNLNASPWAEVWVDGRRVGDTPLANLQLPLGMREVTFRHPQLGERKVPVTVKGNEAVAVSIDLTKPGS